MILVTGATGFIGRYLVEELLKENYEIGILVHKSPPPESWLGGNRVKVFKIDITKEKDYFIIPKNIKIEAVFHLAAYIPQEDNPSYFKKCIEVNCIGTYNLLKFCCERKVKKIINSSSVSVYGKVNALRSKLKEDHPVHPETFYGMSKLMGEFLCEQYMQRFNLEVILLRYSSVCGYGQNKSTVLPIFINKAISHQDLVIFGKGIKGQDFVYVRDVVAANLCTLRSNCKGTYNIGSGMGTNVVELAETIIKIFNSKSKIIFDEIKSEDSSQIIMDISKAEKELGYKSHYDLKSGLKDYCEILTKGGIKHG